AYPDSTGYPGGRTAQNALYTRLSTMASTADSVPPAARYAAPSEPGDIEVSGSSATRPDCGADWRSPFTYLCSWTWVIQSSVAGFGSIRTRLGKSPVSSSRPTIARSRCGDSGCE